MLHDLFYTALGAVLAWNVVPQPAYVKAFWNKFAEKASDFIHKHII